MRVIAGDFKGRKLNSLTGDNTRPTSDKIKGSIFNMIGPYFEGGTVLDLYSGSGNLAIEAISRGCKKAYCIDNHFKAIAIIKENIKLIKREQDFILKKMVAKKALDWFEEEGISFDVIFLDPPYAKQTIENELQQIMIANLLNPRGMIICETDKEIILPDFIDQLKQIRVQQYGITKITIYQLKGEA